MRRIFLMLFVGALVFNGCDNNSQTKNLAINVHSQFEDDLLEIYLDGTRRVLNQKVTTNHSIGADLSAAVKFELPAGLHDLKIVVNNSHELNSKIKLERDLYVGVSFDIDTKQISILQQTEPFVYD